MDTSFWTQCNPKIAQGHTLKKYFGKYLYKIVVYAPAGRIIDDRRDIASALEHRLAITNNIASNGWWSQRHSKDLQNADVELLEVLRDIRRNVHTVKLRVEEPRVQIYAESETELKDLVLKYLTPYVDRIESVDGPADVKQEAILNSGAIIRRSDIGYSHKVLLRDGKYSREIKDSILNYLESLGDEVAKVPVSLSAILSKSSSYIWNGYFYTNEPNIVSFLNLMDPNLVLNIHELVVLPHK